MDPSSWLGRVWRIWQTLMAILALPALVLMLILCVLAASEGEWGLVSLAVFLMLVAARELWAFGRRRGIRQ